MQFNDTNSEKSDDLEQVMNSEGENGQSDNETGENPFGKNRRVISDYSPEKGKN